jgi:hypothetical protein
LYKNRWTYSKSRSEIECLTCNESCGYVNAQFSLGNGSYYILECFGPSIPYSTLHNRIKQLGIICFLLHRNHIYFSAIINENEPFREWTDKRLMPYIDYFSVPLDSKNTGK